MLRVVERKKGFEMLEVHRAVCPEERFPLPLMQQDSSGNTVSLTSWGYSDEMCPCNAWPITICRAHVQVARSLERTMLAPRFMIAIRMSLNSVDIGSFLG